MHRPCLAAALFLLAGVTACGHAAPAPEPVAAQVAAAATTTAPTTTAPITTAATAAPTTAPPTTAPAVDPGDVRVVRPAPTTTRPAARKPVRTAAPAAPKPSTTAPKPPPEPTGAGGCNVNYTPCVPDDPKDVDCAGGSGNGPSYVEGPVRVIGTDVYGLDADHDGIGCE